MRVELEGLTKTLRGVVVLDDIHLTLEEGRIYGIRGKNGSGKTMLLRVLCGLIRPTEGSVLFDGVPLARGAFAPDVGILIENPSFVGEYTALENLGEIAAIKKKADNDEVRGALRLVGLNPDDSRPVRAYSLGMRQRLGIACAVMERPSLILLDEPVNTLDSYGVELVCDLLEAERRHGATVVIACHDSPDVERLFDETYVMEDGRLMPIRPAKNGLS